MSLKTHIRSFQPRSPSLPGSNLLCDGEAFSSLPGPLFAYLKLSSNSHRSLSLLRFLDPRCSNSLGITFFFFSPHCGELWEDNILLDHSQLKAICQYLASLLFLQSLILVSILLFLVSLKLLV